MALTASMIDFFFLHEARLQVTGVHQSHDRPYQADLEPLLHGLLPSLELLLELRAPLHGYLLLESFSIY